MSRIWPLQQIKMFKFLKNVFASKPAENNGAGSNGTIRMAPGYTQPARLKPVVPSAPPKIQAIPKPPAPDIGNGSSNANDKDVHISLQAVLNGLPPQLKSRLRQSDVGDAEILISLEKILSQLSLGSIKITFGEMRRAAPQIFSSQNDLDQTPVALPLGEILAQLNPGLLFRRQSQKRIEVPEEIRSPFGDNGQGLIFSVGPAKAPAPAQVSTIAPAPQPATLPPRQVSSVPPPAPLPAIPFRSSLNSSPTPPPPTATPAGFPPAARTASSVVRGGVGAAPASAPHSPVPAQPAQPAPRAAAPAGEVASLNVPLSLVAEGWPESLRLEIAQLSLIEASIAVPIQALKEALQRGKVFFTWKVLRSWLRPAPLPAVSAHDNTSLELPLKVIAPLFVARQRDLATSQQKVAIDETIPNLFFGLPQPDSSTAGSPATASCAVTRPVDTNFYSANDDANAPVVTETPVKRAGPSGTAFLTRCATPNEIVSRAAALNGISGALIALPDGLMVASKLSADLNGDTLAAFLPQIFGKVNQCTKELRMGELNNLNFTVGNVPWKIFRVNAIFFAAFGRAGQPLPTAELASLAGELDRKKQ
jgi:predicted regulator of Ras-like GTPase activity (Roadblock/LC7/MglB family)